MSSPASLPSSLYTRDYYLRTCGGYEEFCSGDVAPRLQRAVELAGIQPGMTVLDVGCGRGELAVLCARTGCTVTALDYSADAIDLARQHVRKQRHEVAERIDLHAMNAQLLGFRDASFDRVFLVDIVEHLTPAELGRALGEVRRVVRPGGRVVVHTAPNAWLIRPIYALAGALFGWRRHPYHVNEQSGGSLRRLLEPLGRVDLQLVKTPGFFRLGLGAAAGSRSFQARIGLALGVVFDGRLVTALSSRPPLNRFLATDLWAVVDVPGKAVEAA
jgi:SAM-dependent methyltransferase